MLEHLFGSKTRFRLLRTFFQDPDRPYYIRELTRILEVQINAVRRELDLLLASGVVITQEPPKDIARTSDPGAGLRKYVRLDRESVLFPELQALIAKSQLLEEQELVKEIRAKVGNIRLLVLTGRFMSEPHAPSDMLLVGDLDEKVLSRLIGNYEKEFGFPIRYTAMTVEEFKERRHIMDKFVYAIFEGQHLNVVNELGI